MSFVPWVSSMSPIHFLCESTGSTLSAMTFTFRLSNSGFSFATSPSSVVHTGVKSFGCEKRIAQLEPIHSWNLIGPSVESWVKSGATLPRRMDMRAPSFS